VAGQDVEGLLAGRVDERPVDVHAIVTHARCLLLGALFLVLVADGDTGGLSEEWESELVNE
jgi:hypothetical protein